MEPSHYLAFDPHYFVFLKDILSPEDTNEITKIQTLEDYIEQRKKVLESNIASITQSILSLSSELSAAKGIDPYNHNRHIQMERTIIELEREKRQEQTNAWKDIWIVMKELLEIVKEAERKKSMRLK